MGVDWMTCNYCGETFPDCGHYVWCDCGYCWCSDDCAEKEGYRKNEEDEDTEESSCKYCREEDFEDHELLKYALELLNKERQELIEDLKSKTQF